MPRLFIAIDLPGAVKRSLEPLFQGLGDVRWLTEDQLHLTLRFVGELDNGRANDIVDALSQVPGVPFELRLKGMGHFPPRGEPRVIWIGIERQPALTALKRRIDRALQQAGVQKDKQRYKPHVTIARLRRLPSQAGLATYLMRHSLYQSSSFIVSGFALYSSWLDPEGADYQMEARYDLVPGNDNADWGC